MSYGQNLYDFLIFHVKMKKDSIVIAGCNATGEVKVSRENVWTMVI